MSFSFFGGQCYKKKPGLDTSFKIKLRLVILVSKFGQFILVPSECDFDEDSFPALAAFCSLASASAFLLAGMGRLLLGLLLEDLLEL